MHSILELRDFGLAFFYFWHERGKRILIGYLRRRPGQGRVRILLHRVIPGQIEDEERVTELQRASGPPARLLDPATTTKWGQMRCLSCWQNPLSGHLTIENVGTGRNSVTGCFFSPSPINSSPKDRFKTPCNSKRLAFSDAAFPESMRQAVFRLAVQGAGGKSCSRVPESVCLSRTSLPVALLGGDSEALVL